MAILIRNGNHQRIIDNVLAHMIFLEENEEIKGKFTCDQEALTKYCEALEICQKLKEEWKCDFKADDPRKHYASHQLTIIWNREKDWSNQVAPPVKELRKLLKRTVDLTLANDQEWYFYQNIYFPVEAE